MEKISLWINGEEKSTEVAPGEMLADVLRFRFGLTGTKIGCNESECGACTVIMDDKPVMSCSIPAQKANKKHIVTVEGLSKNGKLHPLQDAFVKFGVAQCGFCTPGQLMTAYGLLAVKPDPTEEDIKHAFKDTLCRCGTYLATIRAVKAAALAMREGSPVPPPDLDPSPGITRVVGQVIPRPDAVEKVTGKAMYTDDFSFPGMLHGATKRAGIPHGILKSLDISKAKNLPGVHAVLTAADIPGNHNHGLVILDWPVMVGVGEKVRYVGDAVAIVAADTRDIASQAVNLIEAEYEPLPLVTSAVQASQPDAPLVHATGNQLKHIKVNKGNIEQGFQDSDLIFEGTYFTPPYDHAFLEPECSIAHIVEDNRIQVIVGSQIPYQDRSQVAASLDIDESQVRITGALIGGGFGGKEDITSQIHAAMLTNVTRKPVKILYNRQESLIVHPKRHATQIKVKLGFKKDGTMVAAQTELFGDTGAYASLGEKVLTRATTHSTGPYIIPHVKADCFAMYTNNPPAGAFRGFGVLQSAFAIESLMDEVAESMKMDPVELRRKNALRSGAVTNTGQLLTESVGLLECIDKVETDMRKRAENLNPFAVRTIAGKPNLRRAWGFAVAFKNTGLGGGAPDKAGAEVELYEDGTLEARTSSAEIGQGLVTVLQLIAAEEMGMPVDKVHVLLSDTDLTPDGGPTTASRQTYVTGNAVRHTTIQLREAIKATLAEIYDCAPDKIKFVEGLAQVNGKEIPMGEVAKIMKREGRDPKVLYEYWAPKTQPLGTGGNMHFAYSFATQAVEIELDTDTGQVRVLQAITANDVGKAINPLGLQGQAEGGVIMGIGHVLTEEFIVENGQVVTDHLSRYRMPSIGQVPPITSYIIEHPTAEGPYGGKGVGEVSTIPTSPAVTNAIYNACGIRIKKLPVDQDWLAREIRAKS